MPRSPTGIESPILRFLISSLVLSAMTTLSSTDRGNRNEVKYKPCLSVDADDQQGNVTRPQLLISRIIGNLKIHMSGFGVNQVCEVHGPAITLYFPMDLPGFRYHFNPAVTGRIVPSAEFCPVCGEAEGAYGGIPYGTND